MKICQFKWSVFQEGGGEQVMLGIAEALKAKIYCMRKNRKLGISKKVTEIENKSFPIRKFGGATVEEKW